MKARGARITSRAEMAKREIEVDQSEYDEQAVSRDLELEQGACHLSGAAYPIGAYVQSGGELLQCTCCGVWVRKAERWPERSALENFLSAMRSRPISP
jgi:hypothetical protein